MRKQFPSSARAGFTLVEVMVVISIIVLLAAILIVAIGQAGVKAREQATVALIKKVSNQVQERLEALDRLKSQPQWASDAQNLVGQYNISLTQAKILLMKNRMKLLLPQREADLYVDDIWNVNEYNQFLASSTTGSSPVSSDGDSSEFLYYAITRSQVRGIPTLDPGEFKSSEVADTDGDGLMEFIDAWGRPLRFYRWPTRLFIAPSSYGSFDSSGRPTIDSTRLSARVLFNGLPATNTPDPLMKDQDDPTLLIQPTNASDASTFELNYHTPQTYHHFLIVSSGPDGQKRSADEAFGLYAPTFIDTANNIYGTLAQPTPTGFDALTDNISNRNR